LKIGRLEIKLHEKPEEIDMELLIAQCNDNSRKCIELEQDIIKSEQDIIKSEQAIQLMSEVLNKLTK